MYSESITTTHNLYVISGTRVKENFAFASDLISSADENFDSIGYGLVPVEFSLNSAVE